MALLFFFLEGGLFFFLDIMTLFVMLDTFKSGTNDFVEFELIGLFKHTKVD